MLGTAIVAVLVGGALLVASGGAADAAPAAPCKPQGLNKEISQADVVFRGVVDKARAVRGKGDQRTRTYKVTADRVYQSSLVADKVRVTAEIGAACPPPELTEGKRYIFFVTEQGSRLVSTSATARATHRLTTQVEAKLGSGKAAPQRQAAQRRVHPGRRRHPAAAVAPARTRSGAGRPERARTVRRQPRGPAYDLNEPERICANRGTPAGARRLDLRRTRSQPRPTRLRSPVQEKA